MDWAKCAAFLCIVLITQSKREKERERQSGRERKTYTKTNNEGVETDKHR